MQFFFGLGQKYIVFKNKNYDLQVLYIYIYIYIENNVFRNKKSWFCGFLKFSIKLLSWIQFMLIIWILNFSMQKSVIWKASYILKKRLFVISFISIQFSFICFVRDNSINIYTLIDIYIRNLNIIFIEFSFYLTNTICICTLFEHKFFDSGIFINIIK